MTDTATNGVEARHSSESVEHYTPPEIIEATHATMGGIDLDPASSEIANRTVKARRFFSAASNGFLLPWSDPTNTPSRVFLNPPGGQCDPWGNALIKAKVVGKGWKYPNGAPCPTPFYYANGWPCEHPSRPAQKSWWYKLAHEFAEGRVAQAVFVGFSIEILQQAQVDPPPGLLTPLDCTFCVPSRRLAFLNPDGKVGKSPPHASVLIYLGPNPGAFYEAFKGIGRVR